MKENLFNAFTRAEKLQQDCGIQDQ